MRFLGASLAPAAGHDGAWRIELEQGPNSLNAVDALHGGVIATVLDVAAYLSVLPHLAAEEEAITVAFAAQYVAATGSRAALSARGSFTRRSRRLAFANASLYCEDRLLASAAVTKAIRTSS
jgi:acyl-coenzyme A thioesterase PaaI-like protein